MRATAVLSAVALFTLAAPTAHGQVSTAGAAQSQPTSSGRATETMFQLGMVTPSGDLGETGGVGGGINFVWQRTIAATQHTVGIRLDVPIAAGIAKGNADQGWTFISPALGVVVSMPRVRTYVAPYAFGSVSWNRVSAIDLVSSDEIAETGMGSAFGVGVEVPVGVGRRIAFELRTYSAGLEGWTAQATSLSIGFVSGGIRPPPR